MSEAPSPGRPTTTSGRVEIRVRGRLEPRWSTWFDGLDVTPHDDGTTVIHGPVVDQAALFGVLQRLRDVALPLISVVHVDAGMPDAPSTDNPTDPSTP
jgi:hypothetical protein